MFAEEEVELKDQIIQYLENCGFMSKVKAEIRAGVYLALEEDGVFKSQNPLCNKKFEDFSASEEGQLVVSIVREFLEYFDLQYTLSVFDPEVSSKAPLSKRFEICDKLNLSETEGPILASLIRDKAQVIPVEEKYSSSTSWICGTKNTEVKNIAVDNIPVSSGKSSAVSDSINVPTTISSLEDDNDPFFDDPLPKEKANFFSDSKKNDSVISDTNVTGREIFKKKDSHLAATDSLTSLKNLPSLTGISSHSTDWTFNKIPKNTLPSLDEIPDIKSGKTNKDDDEENVVSLSKTNSEKVESADEGSEKQMNSEESIIEDIEEDLSVGIDDLLNSSLSLGDDATTDQTVSQISVGGIDHIEQINP